MAYYVAGIASVVLGWYFNIKLVPPVRRRHRQRLSGNGKLVAIHHFGLRQPPAASASQDYTNRQCHPAAAVHHRGRLPAWDSEPWLFFVSSLFTSFAFAWAFYLATAERQRRHEKAAQAVGASVG